MQNQYPLVTLACVQVMPEFVEEQIPPGNATAANFVPSADEAMDHQFVLMALVCTQFVMRPFQLV
jgi:hypothetical protein